MDSHRRYALSRHSTMNGGSCFLAEIARTVASLKPGGIVSASISVTNPCWYSRLISDSIELLMPGPPSFASSLMLALRVGHPAGDARSDPGACVATRFRGDICGLRRGAGNRSAPVVALGPLTR